MNKEELLAECKRRYSIGSEFYNAGIGTNCTYKINSFIKLSIMEKDGQVTSACFNPGFLYNQGKWAKIVHKSYSLY